jgi:hypothetical protein
VAEPGGARTTHDLVAVAERAVGANFACGVDHSHRPTTLQEVCQLLHLRSDSVGLVHVFGVLQFGGQGFASVIMTRWTSTEWVIR